MSLDPDPRFAAIARTAHEVWRLYSDAIGDSTPPHWEDAPDYQRGSTIDGVQFLIENPDAGPEACHENWISWKRATGWKLGTGKSAAAKTHPAMVAWAFLPESVRMKDYLFWAVVRGLLAAAPIPSANPP